MRSVHPFLFFFPVTGASQCATLRFLARPSSHSETKQRTKNKAWAMLRSAGFTAELLVFDLSSCFGSTFGLYDAEADRLGCSPHLCVLRSLKNNQ